MPVDFLTTVEAASTAASIQYQYSLMSYACAHNPASGGNIAYGDGLELATLMISYP